MFANEEIREMYDKNEYFITRGQHETDKIPMQFKYLLALQSLG